MRFVSRRCPNCELRFPVADGTDLGRACPRCGTATQRIDAPYPSHEVRDHPRPPRAVELEALFDNIRSVRNVGSMFRSADGAGIGHLHLCGFTPTPDHPQLRKTSLGAEASVPWTQYPDAVATADRLRSRGHVLWAVEGGPRSECLYTHDTLTSLPASGTLILVFGHEVSGVDPRVLDRCAHIVRLPMHGIKGSLNVGVAFGIATYHLTFALRPPDHGAAS